MFWKVEEKVLEGLGLESKVRIKEVIERYEMIVC